MRPLVLVWCSDMAIDHHGLPLFPERADSEVARVVLSKCLSEMIPDGELGMAWEGFAVPLLQFTDEAANIGFEDLQMARVSLEAIEGSAHCGDLLIAASKMALSAFIVGFKNPYLALYIERDEMYDDVHPLAFKALLLAHEAFDCDPFDPSVIVNPERPKRLEGAMEQNWMRGIMDRAVRPDG